ncbi:MAG: M20/M25/M40 family metallo-hydrolase [Acidobacteriota bacterium]|nr:M20/M25/M40 family metallo-hydrolase [Acidobacteriota bacterium]
MAKSAALVTAILVAGGLAASATFAAQPDAGGVAALMRQPAVKAALEAAKAGEPQTIADQIRFCEVPAVEFKEQARAEVLKKEFEALGLQNVHIDRAGNVLGDRPGRSARPHLFWAAHLDTVFPEGTDVHVRREGTVLHGPGIGDDCRGLAVMVAMVRAMNTAHVQTEGTITFVADVGEEGLGDLRGMKGLFADHKGDIDRFVSMDGTGLGIVNTAVGSHRYRVTYTGPGGHSFGAFGLANPIHALGRAIAKIADFQVPKTPKTTFNVGRIGGGTSVNSISASAWMEIDMRSRDQQALADVDAKFHKAVQDALTEENARWGTPGVLKVDVKLIGDRPAGHTAPDAPIVKTALAVTQALGFQTRLGEASTDSNVPMSLGIPAITIGSGGAGKGAHSPLEQFDTADSWQGTQRNTLLAIALAEK